VGSSDPEEASKFLHSAYNEIKAKYLQGLSNISGKDKGKGKAQIEASGTSGLSDNPETSLAKDSTAFTTNILEKVEETPIKDTVKSSLKRRRDISESDDDENPAKKVCTGVSNTGTTSLEIKQEDSDSGSESSIPEAKPEASASPNPDNTVSQASEGTDATKPEEAASQPSGVTKPEVTLDKNSGETKPEAKDNGSPIDYIIGIEETTPIDFWGPDAGD